jgi:hypothetical protein
MLTSSPVRSKSPAPAERLALQGARDRGDAPGRDRTRRPDEQLPVDALEPKWAAAIDRATD